MPAQVPGLHQPRARVPEEVPGFRVLLGSVWGRAWPRIASRCLPAQLTPCFQDPCRGTSQKQRLPNQLQEIHSKALGVRSPEACFSQTGDEGTLLLLPRPGKAEGMLPSALNACGAGQH